MRHLGVTRPGEESLADRWYARLLPRVSMEASGALERRDQVLFDGTFPVRYRQASASASAWAPQLVVWAHWDLSRFVFGDASNVSNPNLLIEREVRATREMLVAEIRWRYREARQLAHALARPPEDPQVALLWRLRLEELTSYLEALAGRPLLEMDAMEMEAP
jgi:hypothetical protein